eukprot:jgi/Picre1/31524/NNA_006876.t1
MPETFVPTLFGHGKEDTFIGLHHSEKLFLAHGADSKNFVAFEGDHNSPRPDYWYENGLTFLLSTLLLDDEPELSERTTSRKNSIDSQSSQILTPPSPQHHQTNAPWDTRAVHDSSPFVARGRQVDETQLDNTDRYKTLSKMMTMQTCCSVYWNYLFRIRKPIEMRMQPNRLPLMLLSKNLLSSSNNSKKKLEQTSARTPDDTASIESIQQAILRLREERNAKIEGLVRHSAHTYSQNAEVLYGSTVLEKDVECSQALSKMLSDQLISNQETDLYGFCRIAWDHAHVGGMLMRALEELHHESLSQAFSHSIGEMERAMQQKDLKACVDHLHVVENMGEMDDDMKERLRMVSGQLQTMLLQEVLSCIGFQACLPIVV